MLFFNPIYDFYEIIENMRDKVFCEEYYFFGLLVFIKPFGPNKK